MRLLMGQWGLDYAFMVRALIGGLLMSLSCGLLSPIVVMRRLSFSADGLAHASLGGFAIGMVCLGQGVTPTWGSYGLTLLFTCLVAVAIAYVSSGQRLHADTAVGACYVAAFSFGIVLLSIGRRTTSHFEHVFFGSLLAVNRLECVLLAGLLVVSLVFCLSTWRWLGQWTFDEELARASGVPVRALRYGFMLLIASAVILATRVVGVLLVTAMLIMPGAVGTLLGRRMLTITLWSVLVALASTTVGFGLSLRMDAPPGPLIVLTAFVCFLAAHYERRRRDQRHSIGRGGGEESVFGQT